MRYATAIAFRTALEERLRQRSITDGTAIERMRKRVAIERFIARLQAEPSSPWYVKGAFALDLRFRDRARTTKDLDLGIDVSLVGKEPLERDVLERLLRKAAECPLEDFFVFSIPGEAQEILQEPGARAYRFTVHATLADRIFEQFKVDVGTKSELVSPVEEVSESGMLTFAGMAPARFRAISLTQQFAEKIHAFTRKWEDRENTRVKDLVDMMLILEISPPDPKETRTAIERIFERRGTHPLPRKIPSPPVTWAGSYGAVAGEVGLTHVNMDDASNLLQSYWFQIFP